MRPLNFINRPLLFVLLFIYVGIVNSGFGEPSVPPSSPSSVTVPSSTSTGEYTVSWTNSVGATFYKWREEVNGVWGTTWTRADNTSVLISNRPDGNYRYQVKSCNIQSGCSFSSTTSNTVNVSMVLIMCFFMLIKV